MRGPAGSRRSAAGVPSSITRPRSNTDHPVGDAAREIHLVGHHDHGHAFVGERLHHAQHLADGLGVERRGRLVEQHELRLHGERAGDRDALLLAARELRRVLRGIFGEADLGEQRARPGLGLGVRQARGPCAGRWRRCGARSGAGTARSSGTPCPCAAGCGGRRGDRAGPPRRRTGRGRRPAARER